MTIQGSPHVGDTTRIFLQLLLPDNTPFDLTTATLKEFHVLTPSGVVKTWAATFLTTGIDGWLYYDCAHLLDLNEPGEWKVQPYIEMPVAQFTHADIFGFTVLANI